jgi:hypothetical protein
MMVRGFLGKVALCAAVGAMTFLPTRAAEEPHPVHDFRLEIGAGYDSNPYLAPDDPYFDQNRNEMVYPELESGFMVPARLDGDLQVPVGQGAHSFVTRYRLKGALYPESDTSNADEVYAKLEPGLRFRLDDSEKRDRFLDVRGFASYKKEIYFDRDTGEVSTVSEVDVSNRYTYDAVGAALVFDYEISRVVGLVIEGEAEQRDYDDPGELESFDHDRLEANAELVLRMARNARLYFGYGYEVRDYSDRHARSLDGDDPVTNPRLEYTYRRFTTTLRLKPRRPWTLEFRWRRGDRSDGFVDYNAYDRDTYRLRSTVRTDRGQWRLTAEYWERDFERAFIFDEPLNPLTGQPNPLKSHEVVDLEFDGRLAWKEHLRPFVRIDFVDQESADPRFKYRRTRGIVGLEFSY